MRRISLDDLRMRIAIALTCMRPGARSAGGWNGDRAVKEATDKIMAHLDGKAIFGPDPMQSRGPDGHTWGDEPGKFGVTEPWPFEPGHRPPTSTL